MKIRTPKLSQDALPTLRRLPTELMAPYHLLLAPVYVYLPKNGKFVAIKLPLQYFTDEELRKYQSYESFYLPAFVDQIAPFQKAGESVRALLVNLRQRTPVKTSEGNESVLLPLAQHEVDHAVLRVLDPLWSAASGAVLRVEPFFLCFFANEVCLAFPPVRLTEALERDSELFELALLRSGVAVFLALHVGYADAPILSAIREKVFEATMDHSPFVAERSYSDPASLLGALVTEALPHAGVREISLARFREILETTGLGASLARKLLSRLARVKGQPESGPDGAPSLFGEKGICDG